MSEQPIFPPTAGSPNDESVRIGGTYLAMIREIAVANKRKIKAEVELAISAAYERFLAEQESIDHTTAPEAEHSKAVQDPEATAADGRCETGDRRGRVYRPGQTAGHGRQADGDSTE